MRALSAANLTDADGVLGGPLPMSACGTKRTCKTALMSVRFEENNGHDADVTRCLLMTHSGK